MKARCLPPSDLIVVVAPPDHRGRARFMVEKLSEMGVAELLFLDTRHGRGRPPKKGEAPFLGRIGSRSSPGGLGS